MHPESRIQQALPAVPPAQRRWSLREAHGRLAQFAGSLGTSELVARLLVNRGVEDEALARLWLSGGLADLPSPWELSDMELAVGRLCRALRTQEIIAIHGDYDVDGCTSTALLVDFLSSLGAQVRWYAPHRQRDGYGLQVHTMEGLAEQGVTLVVTCDNGVSSHEAIARGNVLGVDTVICDHHTLPPVLPEAHAILNPKREPEGSPYEELAAVGLSFLLAVAMRAKLREEGFFGVRKEPDLREHLDLVGLGTVADMAPLRGVNRALVRTGLKVLSARGRPGLRALIEASGISDGEPLEASHLGFRLGPRINAAGRLDESARAVELLLAKDRSVARRAAQDLNAMNKKRQEVQQETFFDVLKLAHDAGDFHQRKGLVLWSDAWHPGVVGVVASKVARHFHRPAIVLAVKDGVATGSGRAIRGLDLFSVLNRYQDWFLRFGGHRAAAGLSLAADRLPELRDAFANDAFAEADPALWEAELLVDAELDLRDINWEFWDEIQSLAPFGIGNPEPVFLARNLEVTGVRSLPKEGIRMQLREQAGGKAIKAIGFGLGLNPHEVCGPIDVVFSVQVNRWRGACDLELRLRDLRSATRSA